MRTSGAAAAGRGVGIGVRRALFVVGAFASCGGEAPERADSDEPAPSPRGLLVDSTATSGIVFQHVHGGRGNRELPETLGGGVGLLDHDQDGDLDAYFVQSGPLRSPTGSESRVGAENELYANRGNGTFVRLADAAGAADDGYGMGCAVGDANGDGADDLLVLNWGPNVLYLNRGGTFEEPASVAPLKSDRWSVSAVFVDADGDGDLDLYVVNYVVCPPSSHLIESINPRAPHGFLTYPTPDVFRGEPDRLWRNDSDVSTGELYVDVTVDSGVDVLPPGKGLGVVATDIDLDGLTDLYVANDGTPNLLFHNLGGLRFEDVGRELGVAFNDDGHSEAGMGVDMGDVDADGDFDLFVTNLDDETNSLYLRSEGGYRDRTRRMNLSESSRPWVGFGASFEDFDLDGDLDLFVCNGHIHDNARKLDEESSYPQANQLFLNRGGALGFELAAADDVDPAVLLPTVSRGSATGDLDGDGFVDLVIGNNAGPPQLLLGRPPDRPFARIALVGPDGNPRGLGGTLWVELEDGTRLLRRVASGRSYASASEPVVVTGVRGRVRSVEVLWPGGRRERFSGGAGSQIALRYGTGE